ncbi:MAG: hypothetical protein ACTSX9_08940 [Candidatus Njordarchaeales archaeon]
MVLETVFLAIGIGIIISQHFLPDFINFLNTYFSILISPEALFMITSLVIFGWLIFNAVILLEQFSEFFASTAGLYALLGSDEYRIFLSPLPQLCLLGIFLLGLTKFFSGALIESLILFLLAIVPATILFMVKKYGRIVRSAIGIFVLYIFYIALGFYTRAGANQNIIVWSIVTILSMVFIAQSRALKFSGTSKEQPDMSVYGLLGMILLVAHYILSFSDVSGLVIEWWLLSSLAVLVAPMVFLVYSYASGRLRYYVERNRVSTIQLFSEMTLILGRVVLTELSKAISRKLLEYFSGKEK